ncbi:MAG: hypothetical protein R2713_14725 [Ilumatobacteraceae bacterium]
MRVLIMAFMGLPRRLHQDHEGPQPAASSGSARAGSAARPGDRRGGLAGGGHRHQRDVEDHPLHLPWVDVALGGLDRGPG